MGFVEQLAAGRPELKRKLIMVKLDIEPLAYVRKALFSSLWLAAMLAAIYFFLGSAFGLTLLGVPVVFLIGWLALYQLLVRIVDVKIHRQAKAIDREVLFAGRFLLVKLNAGRPLILALTEASRSYGIANACFKEIVHDIDLGTPLEDALAKASRYNPSAHFRRILFQIHNALRIGVDVTHFLEATLDEIANDQLIEIQRYGRKLNGLTMFFMLFSIVIPSLGITLFITIVSLMSANFDMSFFLMLAFGLVVVEYFFITLFKSIRPTVNI